MLLTLPLEQRRNELKERELKRGKSAVDELREIILCLWQKKADQKSAKPTRKVQDN